MMEVQETKNALWRREEQLRRWEISDTNSAPSAPRNQSASKVKFQDGCVFLAACSSSDRDEVADLLVKGADIDTTNVDGLTALHQACIDENLSMVKFLVERGACVNLYDNEGWTALHATASCGFVNIARYLIEKGANLEAVNNDGELALDLAEGKEMENLISEAMEKQGIDAEQARNEEEETMIRDANQWLNSKTLADVPHPKTGASALHIAAAKGYIKVMKILMDAGADVNARDFDGWTPLHAAAHWGQEEACKMLVEKLCNLDAKNNAGQTAFDVVDSDIESVLEELKKKQAELIEKDKEIMANADDYIRGAPQGKRRSSITRMSVDQKASLPLKNVEEERAQMVALRQPAVVEEKDEERRGSEESDTSKEGSEEASESDSETDKRNEINTQSSQPWNQVNGSSHKISKMAAEVKEKKPEAAEEEASAPPPKAPSVMPSASVFPRTQNLDSTAKQETESTAPKKRDYEADKNQPSWPAKDISKEPETRAKTVSEPTTTTTTTTTMKTTGVVPPYIKSPISRATSAPVTSVMASTSRLTPVSRQESTQKKALTGGGSEDMEQKNRFNELYNRYASLVAPNGSADQRSRTASVPTSTATQSTVTSSSSAASLSSQLLYGHPSIQQSLRRQTGVGRREAEVEKPAASTGLRATGLQNQSKNLDVPEPIASTQRRASDVSKRDDEKEVERKARAKKARETRRSTQGVSKEDLQKAEEALQAANAQRTSVEVVPEKSSGTKREEKSDPAVSATSTSTTLTSSTASLRSLFTDRKNDDSQGTFRRSLKDPDSTSTTSAVYSPRSSRSSLLLSGASVTSSSAVEPVAPSVSTTAGTQSSSTVPSYRTQYRSRYMQEKEEAEARLRAEEEAKKTSASETVEDKKEEKEDPSQKSAAIRAKKKRDSRRSTGRISLDGLQGPSQDDQDESKEDQDEKDSKSATSLVASENLSTTSPGTTQLISSGGSTYTRFPYTSSTTASDVDYKKLYEEERALSEKLRKEVKQLKQDITDSKMELERVRSSAIPSSSKPLEATSEKRMTFMERRTLERKISELEEELKNSETAKSDLKTDNQRLKDENGALIRVISKLSK